MLYNTHRDTLMLLKQKNNYDIICYVSAGVGSSFSTRFLLKQNEASSNIILRELKRCKPIVDPIAHAEYNIEQRTMKLDELYNLEKPIPTLNDVLNVIEHLHRTYTTVNSSGWVGSTRQIVDEYTKVRYISVNNVLVPVQPSNIKIDTWTVND